MQRGRHNCQAPAARSDQEVGKLCSVQVGVGRVRLDLEEGHGLKQ